jgi:nitroimidazol reductase NimA-like FMN-containing flavoprotein (pyridoxamine 5'-phosphate oxidase superfamily)
MTQKEREAFLADSHIGILSIAAGARGPLTIPIWYEYEPKENLIWMTTGGVSRKGKLLKRVERISLCVHSEELHCKYVSIEGPISIEAANTDTDTRHLAHRYLGVERGDAYISTMRAFMERSEPILVRMRPERWLTFDSSKTA